MTIKELMRRIAGDDLEWTDIDEGMLREMADLEVQMATLASWEKPGGPFLFRLPVEKLRKREIR